MDHAHHFGSGLLRGVLHQVGGVAAQRFGRHPDHRRFELPRYVRQARRVRQHVSAADIQFVLQAHGDRHGRVRRFQFPVVGHDALHAAGLARRKRHYQVAAPHLTGSDLPGKAPETQIGPVYPLHREPEFARLEARGGGHRFQVLDQRRAFIPGAGMAGVGDVIAVERAHGNERSRRRIDPPQILRELIAYARENLLPPPRQVHLVHGHGQVRDAQQVGDAGVPAGPRENHTNDERRRVL